MPSQRNRRNAVSATTRSKPAEYLMGNDADVAGMVWRKGSKVFAVRVTKDGAHLYDVFLTHKEEYAKRGSHAPVTRVMVSQVAIADGVLTLSEEDHHESSIENGNTSAEL